MQASRLTRLALGLGLTALGAVAAGAQQQPQVAPFIEEHEPRTERAVLERLALAARLRALSLHFDHSAHSQHDRAKLIRRIEALEKMRADLEHNTNEALALEAGFLTMFS